MKFKSKKIVDHASNEIFAKWAKSHNTSSDKPFVMDFGKLIIVAIKHTSDPKSDTYALCKKVITENQPATFIIEGILEEFGRNPIYGKNPTYLMNDNECKFSYDLVKEQKSNYFGIENNKRVLQNVKADPLNIALWFYLRDSSDVIRFYENNVIKRNNDILKTKYTAVDIEDRFYEVFNIRANPIISDIILQCQYQRNTNLIKAIESTLNKKEKCVVIFGKEHAYAFYDLLRI
jgi:hypothetical protein